MLVVRILDVVGGFHFCFPYLGFDLRVNLMISSLPQLFMVEVLDCWISIFFLKIGPSVTKVWYSPFSPHGSTLPSFLRSM